MHVQYAKTLYSSVSLRKVVPAYVKAVRKVINRDEYPIVGLVSTGSSGAILAASVMLRIKLDLSHVHVGKSCGHHGRLSGDSKKTKAYIFIDDFIAQGTSLKRCRRNMLPATIPYAIVSDSIYGKTFRDVEIVRV